LKKIKNIFLLLTFCFLAFLLLEFSVRGLCHSRYGVKFCFFNFPGHGLGKHFWINGWNEHFGVWHRPYTSLREVRSCFDVTYTTNAYGARDKERTQNRAANDEKNRHNRVIVLGDSWIEGLGVKQDETIPSFLEGITGVEHLNFGIGGFNSPLQALLRYIHLAKKFDHDTVMLEILPFNDFDDMDLNIGKFLHTNRYRPYLVGAYPDKKIEYFNKKPDSLEAPAWWGEPALNWVLSNSYLARMVEYALQQINTKNKSDKARSDDGRRSLYEKFSRYQSFSEEEFLGLQWVLEKFVEEAKTKTLVLLTFPTLQDFRVYSGQSAGHTPLSDRLRLFVEGLKDARVIYIDLLELLKKFESKPESFFQMCDGHMNAYGNKLASEFIFQELKGKIYENRPALTKGPEVPGRKGIKR